ncbi:MAG: Permease, family [Nitrospira sp.]|nr:Permease, family [Nitrospira sp.]
MISQIGDGLTRVALLFFVYELTGSALKMTVIGVLQTIPPLLFGPFAGVYLDRLPKRATLIVIDLVRVGLLVVIPILYTMGILSLPTLYVIVFIISCFSMAYGPTLSATVPLVAEHNLLTPANALIQSSVTIGQLVGPAVSGMLIAMMGAQNVLYVNAGTFFLSALCKLPIALPPQTEKSRASTKTVWEDLRAGFKFVFQDHRILLLLVIIASVFMFSSTGFIFMLPVIGERVLHVDSVELGWLWSALGAGLLIATLWLVLSEQTVLCRRLWLMAGAALIGGLAVLALIWTRSLLMAALLIAAVGGSSGLVSPIVSASLQEKTPKELLARIFGVFNTGTMGMAILGMTVFGWAADRYDPSFALFAMAAVGVGTALLISLMIPWCQRLDHQSAATGNAA